MSEKETNVVISVFLEVHLCLIAHLIQLWIVYELIPKLHGLRKLDLDLALSLLNLMRPVYLEL